MRTRLLPSRTGTKPRKLPSGARLTSVEISRVVRFEKITSSTSAKRVARRKWTMSPGRCTGRKVPLVIRAISVAAWGLCRASGPRA